VGEGSGDSSSSSGDGVGGIGSSRQQNATSAATEAAAAADEAGTAPLSGVSGWSGAPVSWHRSLDEVDTEAGPALYIAHEFLDALPVHQFERTGEGRWVAGNAPLRDIAHRFSPAGCGAADEVASGCCQPAWGNRSMPAGHRRLSSSANGHALGWSLSFLTHARGLSVLQSAAGASGL
jgi:hypothetical protein